MAEAFQATATRLQQADPQDFLGIGYGSSHGSHGELQVISMGYQYLTDLTDLFCTE